MSEVGEQTSNGDDVKENTDHEPEANESPESSKNSQNDNEKNDETRETTETTDSTEETPTQKQNEEQKEPEQSKNEEQSSEQKTEEDGHIDRHMIENTQSNAVELADVQENMDDDVMKETEETEVTSDSEQGRAVTKEGKTHEIDENLNENDKPRLTYEPSSTNNNEPETNVRSDDEVADEKTDEGQVDDHKKDILHSHQKETIKDNDSCKSDDDSYESREEKQQDSSKNETKTDDEQDETDISGRKSPEKDEDDNNTSRKSDNQQNKTDSYSDDGFEDGTVEIDDEVVQHKTRERKMSSASSSSSSSKKSSISSHSSKSEEKSKGTKQKTADTQKTDKSQTDEQTKQNVHYNDQIKQNDKSNTKTSSTQQNNTNNEQSQRKAPQSAPFRRPVHTANSPRRSTKEPGLRQRPKTTDTRMLPSRGKKKVKHKRDKGGKKEASNQKKKDYFHEELRRLKTRLNQEAKSEKRPEEREYYPYTFTTMGPYCDTHTAEFLICMPDEELQPQRPISRGRSEDGSHGYVSRNTAIGLCDPWVDLRMDRDILPKLTPPKGQLNKDKGKDSKKKQNNKKAKEGSTRLPKFPVVPFNAQRENATRMFPYSEVKKFREEVRGKFSIHAPKRIDSDYKRTRDDFYRMDLDKLDEIHPKNRGHMRKTYFAYLQNTPGSRRAVAECVKELNPQAEQAEQAEQESNSPAVATPQQTAQEAN